MRRRNKPKVVWIPVTNANSIDALNRSTIQQGALVVDHQTNGNFETLELPCVLDGIQSSPLDATSTLSDIENSGYRLRRIVGEIFILCAQSSTDLVEALFVVTAGFIIRRTNQAGASLAAQGAASEVSLDDIENNMDPWIWRRSWIIGNHGAEGTAAPNQASDLRMATLAPHDNFSRGNGSLYTGPHVDQKTARIVGPEERLFLDVTATVVSEDDGPDTTTAFEVLTNLRVLGSMRTQLGNRRNASR